MRAGVIAGVSGLLLGGALTERAQEPHAYSLQGDFWFTHDPSIAKDGSTYYVFATGKAPGGGQLPVRCSEDLVHWRMCGHVFDEIPQWIQKRSPGTKELWAPDISHTHGEYRLYYAYSLFGRNLSGIALATNKTLDSKSPDYKWVDKGLVLESRETDDFNAIDPNYVEDAHHHAWLSFGSFWTGIKMRALNAETGMLSEKDRTLYSLASRVKPEHPAPQKFDPEHPTLPPDWQAIEAPFIVEHGGYYYLFASFDLCCRGTQKHLPHDGWTIEESYRTVRGQGRHADVERRRVSSAGAKPALAGARWGVDFAGEEWQRPDCVSCI